jgi:hypothetical protein
MNDSMVAIIVLVSALLPRTLDHQREAGGVGDQPDRDLRLQPAWWIAPRIEITATDVLRPADAHPAYEELRQNRCRAASQTADFVEGSAGLPCQSHVNADVR